MQLQLRTKEVNPYEPPGAVHDWVEKPRRPVGKWRRRWKVIGLIADSSAGGLGLGFIPFIAMVVLHRDVNSISYPEIFFSFAVLGPLLGFAWGLRQAWRYWSRTKDRRSLLFS